MPLSVPAPSSARRSAGSWRRAVACGVAAALLIGVMPSPVAARWNDQSGSLPGIVSGKSIVLTAVIAGGAALAMVIYMKRRGVKGVQLQVERPRFAKATVGDTTQQPVGITNLMGDPITIKEISLEGNRTSFTLTEARQVPFTVAPGERVDIPIHYAPSASGGSSGRLRIIAASSRLKNDTVKIVRFSASAQRLGADASPREPVVAAR